MKRCYLLDVDFSRRSPMYYRTPMYQRTPTAGGTRNRTLHPVLWRGLALHTHHVWRHLLERGHELRLVPARVLQQKRHLCHRTYDPGHAQGFFFSSGLGVFIGIGF
eukprot:2788627-Pyramimonas_sp.AAC.1